MDLQSFKNFSKTRKGLDKNGNNSFLDYKTYLTDNNVTQGYLNTQEKQKIREQYINAIQYVLINLTSKEEKIYFKDLDLTNNQNLSNVIPLVASKLKQVATYIASERERAKFSVIRYNMKGSEFGTTIYTKNIIYTLYNDKDFTNTFSSFPSLNTINFLDVGITYYYGRNEDYFDKDYNKGMENPEIYDGGKYEDLNLLYFNQDLYFPELSGGVIAQYNELKNNFLVSSNDSFLLTQSKLRIKRKIVSSNINDLDVKYFLYGEKSEENLIFNIIKNGVSLAQENYGSNKFIGNDVFYVSGANTTTPVSGLLIKAAKKYSNILNFRNFTLQAVKNTKELQTLQQIGGFFLPHKQGISISLSKYYSYYLNNSLSGTNITPDPKKSINIRGNSKINYPYVWDYEENPGWIINSLAGNYNWGKIKNIRPYQKFNGYHSYEEFNYEYKSGINKTIESFDFFTGPEKSVWANSDVYLSKIPNPVPMDTKQDNYNVGTEDIYRWQGDIFGNNYALFKKFNNYDTPDSFDKTYTSNVPRSLKDFNEFTGVITSTDEVVYLNRKSSYNTLVQTLCTTKLINSIDEKKYLYGEIKLKTFNNTAMTTLTAAFSSVLQKYPQQTKEEINNKVITFNIIEDVIIIKTENYKIMERFKFDLNKNTFEPFYPFQTNLQ